MLSLYKIVVKLIVVTEDNKIWLLLLLLHSQFNEWEESQSRSIHLGKWQKSRH